MHQVRLISPAQTIRSVCNAMSAADHFPFILDGMQLGNQPLDTPLKSKERLHLLCTQRLPDGTLCGHPVPHTVGNILHAVKNPEHLNCQGPCDSKKKGKARRIKVDKVAAELADARLGTWTIVPETYLKKSLPVQLVHGPCGNIVRRKLSNVLDFPSRSGLPADTDADCPYCSVRSARPALGENPVLYSVWLTTVTDGKLAYRSGSLAPQDRDTVPLEVDCKVCKSVFLALESQLINSDFCGCRLCAENHSHRQRAWVLDEAKQVVARRGMILEGDPGSYTAPATILTAMGASAGFPDILSLVRALPARADGFRLSAQQVIDTSNTGRPYTLVEESIIRRAHSEQRSKSWLCRELRRSVGSINQKCKKLGLRFDQWEHVNRRIEVDDEFFAEFSVRKAYWAGLLAADGCLSKEITIELKVVDEIVLQQFMLELGHTGALTYRTMKNVDGRGLYAALRFRSRQITDDLQEKYRLTPRKSLTLQPPDLTETEHIIGYINGLFEGDGCIRISPRDGLIAQVCTASLEMINWLQQIMLLINVKSNFKQVTNRGNKLYEITWCGANAERLLTTLTDVVNGAMDRKWKIFADYLETKKTK
jgi:hypothetical protein